MIEIGTLLQERYLIEKQIGAGGMGAVYLAIDKRFDNHVAIKETFYKDEEFGEAFEREARLLNALQHQVLPHVTDYFSENNGYFLVMQFIEGEDLSDILKREGAFPAADVIRWTDSLLDALDYLHSRTPPIIHRDIKPHNLKITPRGDIMLLDFGLAKLNSEDTLGAISVFGYSRTYSPLEQIQGTGTDARSDIFALGATVYHLLTGKPPVDALTRAASIVNGKEDPLQSASEINPEISGSIASVLNSALALNPENRFISAQAMRQALDYAVGENTKGSFIENAAQPPEMIPQVVPIMPDAPIIDTAENENFPALEAFAAGTEQQISEDATPNFTGAAYDSADKFVNDETQQNSPSENSPSETSQPDILPQQEPSDAPIVVETSPKTPLPKTPVQGNQPRKNALLAAAAAAILIFGIIATALYFSGREDAAGENPPAPSAEANSAVNSNTNLAEKLTPGSETVAETKKKPTVIAGTDEKNAGAENAPAAEQNSQTVPNPPVEPAAPTKRKKQASSKDQNDAGNVEESTTDAAEVETVFTGRENDSRTSRNQRRRSDREVPDEMSEEEFEQFRREQRQRRRERRARRNNDPIPF